MYPACDQQCSTLKTRGRPDLTSNNLRQNRSVKEKSKESGYGMPVQKTNGRDALAATLYIAPAFVAVLRCRITSSYTGMGDHPSSSPRLVLPSGR